jgi:hypothetical protein
VRNENSSLAMSNVNVSIGATYLSALSSTSSSPVTVTADRSTFIGAVNNGGQSIMKIGESRLFGGATGDGLSCVGSYDNNYVALGTNCR